MKDYYYDLHIHSCLSPCGDNASSPDSIAGMGELNGLDIMALTDHNTCKNCPAFFEAAGRHGILPVAGAELTTAEDIHLLCLFPNLDKAMEFDGELQKRRIKIKNRTDIFGDQLICDSFDNIIGTDEYLLSNATDISLDEAADFIDKFDGICIPAHIDRDANGIISVLGDFPMRPVFSCAEFRHSGNLENYKSTYSLTDKKIIINSDAHFLWDIKEKTDYLTLADIPESSREAGRYIIDYLRAGL